MIFAAGLGSRLKHITEHKPKALVSINDKTLLQLNIEKLIEFGIKDIIVNVHHFSEQVKSFLQENNNFNVNITVSDETGLLLDTGGGLKKASVLLKDSNPILLQNVDIFSDIDYSKMLNYHIKHNSLATLAVQNRDSSRYLLFNNENKLSGWQNVKTKEKIITRDSDKLHQYSFSGIHIISPKIFDMLPNYDVFSIVKLYLDISKDNNIISYLHNKDVWFDVGTVERLNKFEKYMNSIKK